MDRALGRTRLERILVRSFLSRGSFMGFPGEGCGVSFWFWGTLVEWAFVVGLTIHGDRNSGFGVWNFGVWVLIFPS